MDLLSTPNYERFDQDDGPRAAEGQIRISYVSGTGSGYERMEDPDDPDVAATRSAAKAAKVKDDVKPIQVTRRMVILTLLAVFVLALVVSLVVALAVVYAVGSGTSSQLAEQYTDECASSPCTGGATCLALRTGYHCLSQPHTGGATYVRWGRTVCPDDKDTEMVYSGRVGGQYYSQTGGAATYLCLPMDPQWGNYSFVNENRTELRNYVHGAEYEKEDFDTYPFSSANTDTLDDRDVPCAVCLSKTRVAMVMIPARRTCYAGWRTEYSGYLMSELYKDSRTEHICVDHEPEVVNNSRYSWDGVGLFLVESACGSLPCPPYANDRELTCAVCTK